jgi:hypothetical protein
VTHVRTAYGEFFNELQSSFHRAVDREGWPLDQLESNPRLFDKTVRPLLQDGRKVIYLLVDALRWELAQQLSSLLSDAGETVMEPVASQLPGVTPIAMAALLPGAEDALRLEVVSGKLCPMLNGKPVDQRAKRMAAFRDEYNEQFAELNLKAFLTAARGGAARQELAQRLETVRLLVITSTEIDELGESGFSLSDHIPQMLTQLVRAIRGAASLGFEVAVVAADHGFIWLDTVDGAFRADPPVQGEWSLAKRRCYVGKGDPAIGSKAYTTAELSIPTTEPTLIAPQNLAVYSTGQSYFHEGLSLQECIVPKLVIRFPDRTSVSEGSGPRSTIRLSRRRNVVSSLIVSVNVDWPETAEMFAPAARFVAEVLQNDTVVGEPISGPGLDPSTGHLSLKPSEEGKISLRLTEAAVEGSIAVVLTDARTGKRVASLDLNYQPNV